MGTVISMQGYQERKASELAEYDPLECPKCEAMCPPLQVDEEGSVHHHCTGGEHRPFTWRISRDGVMLSGRKGQRELKI